MCKERERESTPPTWGEKETKKGEGKAVREKKKKEGQINQQEFLNSDTNGIYLAARKPLREKKKKTKKPETQIGGFLFFFFVYVCMCHIIMNTTKKKKHITTSKRHHTLLLPRTTST